jgi:glyoxylase-like metal-dependent hydrolase (beta-lactamase superfamily II)
MAEKVVRLSNSLFRLGPLGDQPVLSSYLIVDEKIAIVDCGPLSVIDELLTLVEECGVSPAEIDELLLTHIHLDHAGGTAKFLERCRSANVCVPERGFKHLLNPEVLNSSSKSILGDRIFNSWGGCDPIPEKRSTPVRPHDKIKLGEREVEYVPATGHAPHHNILVDSKNSIIFSADALGIYDRESKFLIPTTPPPSFNLDQAIVDIAAVRTYRPGMVCMAHFAEIYPDDVHFELVTERFRKWAEIVSSYVDEGNLKGYDLNDCTRLLSMLSERWPEYGSLSEDLKEQVMRVDIGGLLNYFIKNSSRSA